MEKIYLDREDLYNKARELRVSGLGYCTIAKKINLPSTTVRNWVRDIPIQWSEAYKKGIEFNLKKLEDLHSKTAIRNYLIRTRGGKCQGCNLEKWLNKNITLEVEHSDGNNKNNTEKNLLLLCPNCHSLTPTWRRKARLAQR